MKQLPRLSARLLLLGAIASPGCTVQITNPNVSVNPNVVGPVIPKPTLAPNPQEDSCVTLGSSSASFVFPKAEPRACPAIYPPPPGCQGEDRGVYGEFAGLRAPVAFQGLPDAAAVRARLQRIYNQNLIYNQDQPTRLPPPLGETRPGREPEARGAAGTRVLMLSIAQRSPWECLQEAYPELAQAFLAPSVTPTPPVPSVPPIVIEPEPWFPLPCFIEQGQTVTLAGGVYDGQGTPFQAEVEVRVSTADFSYSAESKVVDGRWEVSGAPAGVRLQVTAVHVPSGESRRRFVVPQAAFADCGQPGFATVNFGGRTSDADPLGPRYAMAVSAPEQRRETTALTVLVYDVAGQPLRSAAVTLRSLNPDAGYSRTANVAGEAGGEVYSPMQLGGGLVSNPGSSIISSGGAVAARPPAPPAPAAFTFEGVPTDTPLELRAQAPGFHEVLRLVDPLSAERRHRFAFGGPATRTDPMAPQYGLIPVEVQPIESRVTVTGRVFRQADGAPVREGTVRLGLEAGGAATMQETTISPDGTYRFEGLTARTRASITVDVPGFESMTRLVRIGRMDVATFNFGGPATKTDPLAAAFGLVETIRDQ